MPRKPVPERPRRGFRLPFLLIAATGLAGVLPWFGADLVHHWQAAAPSASAPPAPAPVPTPPPPAAAADAVVLPSGRIAEPVSVATLAATEQPSPIGDQPGVDGRILAEVARRKAELDQREKALQVREEQVAAAEKLARQQIAELTQLRQAIEAQVRHESAASEADLNLLVGLFSNMKPVQAAAVIGKLDPPKAALLLQRLDTRLAGPIVAAMDPAAALAITEEVEQRRAAFQH
jgi:flagellar motility protein MotE (MotC chaperone)